MDDKHLENSTAIYNHTKNIIQISNILFENLYLFSGNYTEWYHYVSNKPQDKGGLISECIFTVVPTLKMFKITVIQYLMLSIKSASRME